MPPMPSSSTGGGRMHGPSTFDKCKSLLSLHTCENLLICCREDGRSDGRMYVLSVATALRVSSFH